MRKPIIELHDQGYHYIALFKLLKIQKKTSKYFK